MLCHRLMYMQTENTNNSQENSDPLQNDRSLAFGTSQEQVQRNTRHMGLPWFAHK